jgi:hypothetical protein
MSISGMGFTGSDIMVCGTTFRRIIRKMDAIKRFHPFAGLTHLEITAIKNPGL